jgi:hypothetical protein
MNKILNLLIFTVIACSLHAQSQVETLLNDAKKFNSFFIEGDMDKHIDMTIPSVVETAGGKEIMVANAKESYEMTTKSGVIYETIEPLKPSQFLFAGKDLQSILPQNVITKIGDIRISQKVYFLASSSDEGKTWTFLNLEPYDTESIKTFIPNVSKDLEIPASEVPVVLDGK